MFEFTANISQAPNPEKLHEDLDALALGPYTVKYPTSYPGDLHCRYDNAISDAEKSTVTSIITAHDSSNKTTEQTRKSQDTTDLLELRTLYDARATWTSTEVDRAVELLARAMLRVVAREAI